MPIAIVLTACGIETLIGSGIFHHIHLFIAIVLTACGIETGRSNLATVIPSITLQ